MQIDCGGWLLKFQVTRVMARTLWWFLLPCNCTLHNVLFPLIKGYPQGLVKKTQVGGHGAAIEALPIFYVHMGGALIAPP